MSLDRDLRARFWTSLHSFLAFIFPFPIFLRFLFSFLWSPLSFIGVNIIFFFNRRFHTKVAKAWPRVPKDYSFFFFFFTATIFRSRGVLSSRRIFSLSLFSLFSFDSNRASFSNENLSNKKNRVGARYYHIYIFISFSGFSFFSFLPSFVSSFPFFSITSRFTRCTTLLCTGTESIEFAIESV